MIRRTYLVGLLALGLMAVTVRSTPAYHQLVSSAASFERYLDSLRTTGNTLSPIERLVFSLVLSNSRSPHTESLGTAPARRT
jgi:hypothetical protein